RSPHRSPSNPGHCGNSTMPQHRSAQLHRVLPVLAAARVALAFPDRDAGLDLVDDVAAGGEGGVAVGGGDADPDGEVADRQVAGTVHAAGIEDVEALHGLGQDALAL